MRASQEKNPSQKLIVFKKLHDIENWNLELKCHLAPKYNKIVNAIKCILERVNENCKAWCEWQRAQAISKKVNI